jgi:ABC-type cobalt transport system substrate-binding protein
MTEAKPWEGVDETVVKKVAAEAGHPAREPYINTDQGDLLLFLFLLAGAIGGFIIGYTFRGLFPARKMIVDKGVQHEDSSKPPLECGGLPPLSKTAGQSL